MSGLDKGIRQFHLYRDMRTYGKFEPLYTEADALHTLKHFVTYHYWRSFEPLPGVRVIFQTNDFLFARYTARR